MAAAGCDGGAWVGGEEESGERRAEQRRGGEEGCCVRPDTPGPTAGARRATLGVTFWAT